MSPRLNIVFELHELADIVLQFLDGAIAELGAVGEVILLTEVFLRVRSGRADLGAEGFESLTVK